MLVHTYTHANGFDLSVKLGDREFVWLAGTHRIHVYGPNCTVIDSFLVGDPNMKKADFLAHCVSYGE